MQERKMERKECKANIAEGTRYQTGHPPDSASKAQVLNSVIVFKEQFLLVKRF